MRQNPHADERLRATERDLHRLDGSAQVAEQLDDRRDNPADTFHDHIGNSACGLYRHIGRQKRVRCLALLIGLGSGFGQRRQLVQQVIIAHGGDPESLPMADIWRRHHGAFRHRIAAGKALILAELRPLSGASSRVAAARAPRGASRP